jgi:hypothetical protein
MKRLLLLVVALGLIALTGLTVSREKFNALVDSLVPSSVDLAVEVEPLRNEPNSKYGNITITNLSKETVTIKHVSINRSSEAACSFDPKELSITRSCTWPRDNGCNCCSSGRSLRVNFYCYDQYRQGTERLQIRLDEQIIRIDPINAQRA